jgi:hypothetical protein
MAKHKTPVALLIATLLVLGAPPAMAASFHEVSTGTATQIAAGDGTSPWILGTDYCGTSPNRCIYYYDSGSWKETNGNGVAIGLEYYDSHHNYPLLTNAAGTIYLGVPTGYDIDSADGTTVNWYAGSGCGTSITGSGSPANGPGGNYSGPFITGCTAETGGYTPYSGSYNGTSGPDDWTTLSGAGTQISISQDNSELWMINSSNEIYQYTGTPASWVKQGGPDAVATSVSAGAGTTSSAGSEFQYAWIVGTDGYLWYWNQSTSAFDEVTTSPGPSGSIVNVSVGWNGTVWLTDSDNHIWYYN